MAKSKSKGSKFTVGWDSAQRRAAIYAEGQGLEPGFKSIGTFDANIDQEDNTVKSGGLSDRSGDHLYIRKAQELIEAHGVKDLKNITYFDRASQAPKEDEIPTIQEVEDENREKLLGNPDEAASELAPKDAKPANQTETAQPTEIKSEPANTTEEAKAKPVPEATKENQKPEKSVETPKETEKK